MTELTPLHEALLELGLGDWIPLPEVFGTPEVRPHVEGRAAVRLVSSALIDLLEENRIQVWFGQWWEDSRPASGALARELLLEERRYTYDAEDAGLERVYYVNVANIRAE